MISDFEVLGIQESDDINAIKAAFRRRVKDVHPDLFNGEDAFKRHILFIQINQAYKRILATLNARQNNGPIKEEGPRAQQESSSPLIPSEHRDPAYVLYKMGCKFFSKIHPSQWNLETRRMLETYIPGEEENQEELRKRVQELAGLFPKAYYYFSIVVNEYPTSIWAADARDKTEIIEERTKRYRNIIDSFSDYKRELGKRAFPY